MSDVPPPPLPPEMPPGFDAPAPAAPAQAQLATDPYPHYAGAPLAYSLPTTSVRPTRPAIVTALGVLSLLAAFLGAAGGVATIVAGVAFYAGAQAMGRDAAATAASLARPQPAPQEPVRRPPDVTANGIPAPQRGSVLQSFYAIRPLRPPRDEQLDAMLARHGRTILLTAAERQAGLLPMPDKVRALVEDHGELFSTNRALAPEFFRLPNGRLELYDDRAVFYPADGTATLRSSFGRVAVRRALSDVEVAEIVKQAKYLSREKLSDAQAATLATALSAPDQKLVGAAGPAAPSEPGAVTPGAGGAVTIAFSGAALHLGPEGQVLGGPPPPAPPPQPSTAAFVTVMVAALAGVGLAVLLFVAAVLLLRGLPSGRRLHRAWAWAKIPLAAVVGVAFWWMTSRFYGDLADYNLQSPTVRLFNAAPRWMPQPWHPVVAALLALAYPVFVLLALRARSLREYFNPVD